VVSEVRDGRLNIFISWFVEAPEGYNLFGISLDWHSVN
jgi:hypothetical protein